MVIKKQERHIGTIGRHEQRKADRNTSYNRELQGISLKRSFDAPRSNPNIAGDKPRIRS